MDEQQQPIKDELPESWKENTGSQYEKLTGDKGKLLMVIIDVKKEVNQKFRRTEYVWRIFKVLPSGILTEKILTESSKRFCAALKAIDEKHPVVGTDELLVVEWEKVKDNKGREVKEWNIKRIEKSDLPKYL